MLKKLKNVDGKRRLSSNRGSVISQKSIKGNKIRKKSNSNIR